MRMFVIGGTGYLGRRLLTELAYDPDVSITALARGDAPPALRLKNIEWIRGETALTHLYAHRLDGVDVLLNMGGEHNPAAPIGRDGFMAANAAAVERLVHEVRRHDVKLLIHVADACALGDTGNVTGDEEFKRRAGYGCDYEESQAEGLRHVESLRSVRKYIAALVGPTFGKDDPGFLQPLLERAAAGTLGTVVGAGHFFSPLHVDDLKEGLLQLILQGDDDRRYVLAGEPIEFQNLVHMVTATAGKRTGARGDGMLGRMHAGVFGRLGLSAFTPPLADYLCGASYAYESHRAKKELRWSHGLLRDRLVSTLREAGLA